MLNRGERRLVVNLDELRDYAPATGDGRRLCDGLLNEPSSYMPAFDAALQDVVMSVYDPIKHAFAAARDARFHIGLRGSFGDHHVSPRTLRSAMLGRMVSIEGIVTRCSAVRPKVTQTIHFCPDTKHFHSRAYTDQLTSAPGAPPNQSGLYPRQDLEGHRLETEYGLSTYVDHQSVAIQEMPERAPAGQLPRAVEVVFDDDLVDRVKPGDRVQIVGAYRSLGSKGGSGSAIFFHVDDGQSCCFIEFESWRRHCSSGHYRW